MYNFKESWLLISLFCFVLFSTGALFDVFKTLPFSYFMFCFCFVFTRFHSIAYYLFLRYLMFYLSLKSTACFCSVIFLCGYLGFWIWKAFLIIDVESKWNCFTYNSLMYCHLSLSWHYICFFNQNISPGLYALRAEFKSFDGIVLKWLSTKRIR